MNCKERDRLFSSPETVCCDRAVPCSFNSEQLKVGIGVAGGEAAQRVVMQELRYSEELFVWSVKRRSQCLIYVQIQSPQQTAQVCCQMVLEETVCTKKDA